MMWNRMRISIGLAALVLSLTSVPVLAADFGGSGEIDSIDSSNRTIIVGKYTLYVVGTSVMLDEHGRQMSFSQLANVGGSVGFTMRKVGPRWELIRLVVEEPDDDES